MRVAFDPEWLGDLDGFTYAERDAIVEAFRLMAERILRERGFDVEVVADADLARRQPNHKPSLNDPTPWDPETDPVVALVESWNEIVERVADG